MQFHYNKHITIGFAGKRRHDRLDIVAGKLEQLFKAFDEKLHDHHLHFVTGLADGADIIATDAFLKYFEEGIRENKRSCGAILPFAKASYLHTIAQKKEFERLYAKCSQVMELDGKNEKGKTPNHILERAYQQQGRVLGYLSDIFLAVTPKSEKGKAGGTKESLISVLTLRKPVILLNLDDGKFYFYQTLEEWFGEDIEIQPEQIAEILFNFDADILRENLPENTERIYQKRISGLIFLSRKKAWVWFEGIFKKKRKRVAGNDMQFANSVQESLHEKQSKLDEVAAYYQYQYRGGYILTYILALIAVLLAVASSVVFAEMFNRGHENTQMINILIAIGFFKLIVITGMLINTKNINKSAYNQKAIYYRYAAERLRINYFLSIIGVLRSPRPNLGNHSKKHFSKYIGEAIYQNKITPHLIERFNVVISKEVLQNFLQMIKDNWIESQKKYHRSASDLMGRMDKHFRHLPGAFSIAVLVIVGFDILVGILFGHNIINISYSIKNGYDSFALPILLGLTALFPAIVSTLNGIHSQSETHRLLMRSQSMVGELDTHIKLIAEEDVIIENNNEGSDFFHVLKLIDELANVFTDEVAEWSLLYEKRVEEPG